MKEFELSKKRQFVQMSESNRTNSIQLNSLTSKNDGLNQDDKNARKDIVYNRSYMWTNWDIQYRFKTVYSIKRDTQ